MDKKLTAEFCWILLFSFMLINQFLTVVKAEETIYIRSDGTVDPPTAPISKVGDVYTFTDNISGFIVIQKDNIIIDGNNYSLQGSGSGRGFDLYERSNVTIKNTKITGFFNGIYLSSSSGNTISDNYIGTSVSHGIYLYYSDSNLVSRNTITNNYQGTEVAASSGNTINRNIIANNTEGIRLHSSDSNIIYHNNFIDNTIQVYNKISTNTWDNGYPDGGNYWSDYNGTDIYHGSDQNEIGSDGIGDTPYIIDVNNRDNYPLMTLWTPGPPVNLAVKTFGWTEIVGVKVWVDSDQRSRYYCSPVNISVRAGQHTVKVQYGFLEPGPEEGSYFKYSFMYWENGLTSKIRNLQLDKDKTIIAYYKLRIIYLW